MQFTERNGIRIAFDDSGSGPCILLLHSFLCSGRQWEYQVPVLNRSYRVVNIDMRGHGGSGHADTPFTLDDLVADVVAVLDHLGIEKAAWCGLSIGGMISLRAALDVPERVAALVLADTHAGAETIVRKLRYRAMGLGVRWFGIPPFLPAVLRLMFAPSTLSGNPELVSQWEQEMAAVHVPSVLRGLKCLLRRQPVSHRLGDIDAPALVIVGAEDRSLPPRLSQELDTGLPRSRYVELPAAGHLSALEQPGAFNTALLEFLAGQNLD